MKDREYKEAWQELKDEWYQNYIKEKSRLEVLENINNISERFREYKFAEINGRLLEIAKFLLQMGKLDNTNEFSNLLSDLEDE